ncbi:unnamed protein product [Urochloa decumbens]|uniref:Uncharacterized protein n=1 Tax=Urochloa decumbens TaxID=240449 RepID=A0ABC9B7D8_9POAL
MSGLFASLSVGRAWEKLSSFLRVSSSAPSSSSASPEDDLEDLRKLERTMRRIRATLHDAEEHWNIREESAKLRLKELKDLAYDMEDVVDEYEYEVNQCEVLALDRSASIPNTGKRKHQEVEDCNLMDTGVVAVPHDLVLRARKITERFNEIVHYSEHLSLSENDGERRFAPDIRSLRHTSSVIFEKSILGRDQDKDKIIDKLLFVEGGNVGNPVSVMAIVGMGGLGKTTLAQLVYNNPRLKQCFEKYAWVCVSEHFDVNTITRNTITSLTSVQCAYTELADLQMKLANEISERRVLLVLDDIWNERRDCWELFCRPLSTAKFCQIIVTTRSEQVARLIQTMPCYFLSCLTSDESWSLFSQAAFIVEQESDIPTNLRNIGKCIVQKCKGLPLAIKTLGSMLRYETDKRRWEDVLENDLWDFEQPRNEVLPALELSYKNMPVYLRRCFISMCLYPKAYQFEQHKLLNMWKLLDLLRCDGNDDEDAIGRQYLNELIQRSMLQIGLSRTWYCLHDLIRDLTCFLAGEEFYRLEGDPLTEIPENISTRELRNINKVRELRIGGLSNIRHVKYAQEAQLQRKKYLQSLKLSFSVLKEKCPCGLQPETVRIPQDQLLESLRPHHNLRELKIISYDSSIYPAWLGDPSFYMLTTIHLIGGRSKHLPVLGGLPSLKYFHVHGMDSVENIGSEIFRQFPGDKYFPSLTNLEFRSMLEWSEWSGVDAGEHPCLNELSILFCEKLRSLPLVPLRCLVALRLFECHSIAMFPELPALRELKMEGCYSLSDIPTLPSLVKLNILKCENLRSIGFHILHMDLQLHGSSRLSVSAVSSLPKLAAFTLHKCPNLKAVGYLPSLVNLRLNGPMEDELLYSLLNDLPSLDCLEILFNNATSIHLKQRSMPSLTRLCLICCPNLQYCDGLASLTSLEYLEVKYCPELPIYNLHPPQLKTLTII